MNFLNLHSVVLSRQTSSKHIRKKNFKHFLRISSSRDLLMSQGKFYSTQNWLKKAKSIFGFKQIDSSILKNLHLLKQGQKTLRYCSINSDLSRKAAYSTEYKALLSFIKNSSNLETLIVPINKETTNLIGEISTLRKLSIILEDDFQDHKLLQKIKYKIRHLSNLTFLDVMASGSSLHCLVDLYSHARTPFIGVNISRTRISDELSFLSPNLLKLHLSNIPLQLLTQILTTIPSFENLQSLSIKRIEEAIPENFTFEEFGNLRNLSSLREFYLNIFLGSIELTQNLLTNIRFPSSLEGLYLWLTGVCLSDSEWSLNAYKNFGESLGEVENLSSLPLLWDVKSGLKDLNTLFRYFPKKMANMKNFRVYTCSLDSCERADILLPNLLEIISPMRNLTELFLNFEDISLTGGDVYRSLGEIRDIRFMYILSTSTKVVSLSDYYKLIDFIKQNQNIRNLTFECSPDFCSKKEIHKLADMLRGLKHLEHLSLRIKVKDVLIDSFYVLGEAMRMLQYLKERFIEVIWQSMSDNFNESICVKIFSPHWKFVVNCISIHDEKGRQLYRVRS